MWRQKTFLAWVFNSCARRRAARWIFLREEQAVLEHIDVGVAHAYARHLFA